jgi:hypothetical protein
LVDFIAKSANENIRTLSDIEEELSGTESSFDELQEVLGKLRNQESNAHELRDRLHENDLPPLRGENTNEESSPNTSGYFPQDSSDVHQSDFPSFDPFGEE